MMRRDRVNQSGTGRTWRRRWRRWRAPHPPPGAQRWTVALLTEAARRQPPMKDDQPRDHPADSKKNLLKPWCKLMWCIGELTAEYRRRMYELLELYARPHDPREPVICLDEKSKQLLRETRRPLPAKPASAGQAGLRVRAGRYLQHLRRRRTARPATLRPGHRPAHQGRFCRLRLPICCAAVIPTFARCTWSLDNLNTHMRESFEEVLGAEDGGDSAAPDRVPLHAQARQLAKHGRDRDRRSAAPVPGALRRRAARPCRARWRRGRGAATPLDAGSTGPSRVGMRIGS